jgi:hypothetical protein
MNTSVRLLVWSQLSLGLFLLVCIVLIPHFLFTSNEGGVSNYGTYALTIIPYTLAFGLGGLLMIWAAHILPKKLRERRTFQWVIAGVGWLYLLALESTYAYQVNTVFDNIHVTVGALLFTAQVVSAVWLGRTFVNDRLQTALLVAELVGFCLLVITFVGYLHILLVAELVAGACFGALLIRSLKSST